MINSRKDLYIKAKETYEALLARLAKRYDENSGIGTLISTMLPYSLIFLAGWSAMLILWMILGLPLGPGAGLWV